MGLDVELARDGAEALRAIDGSQYDVVLVDLVMPRVDGRQVLAQVPVRVVVEPPGQRADRAVDLQRLVDPGPPAADRPSPPGIRA